MTPKEHLKGKLTILLKAVTQYKNTETANKLLDIVEKEIHSMLAIVELIKDDN